MKKFLGRIYDPKTHTYSFSDSDPMPLPAEMEEDVQLALTQAKMDQHKFFDTETKSNRIKRVLGLSSKQPIGNFIYFFACIEAWKKRLMKSRHE